jgi:hypothetical protein
MNPSLATSGSANGYALAFVAVIIAIAQSRGITITADVAASLALLLSGGCHYLGLIGVIPMPKPPAPVVLAAPATPEPAPLPAPTEPQTPTV